MLNSKQKKFIPEFIKTGSINAACKIVKIDRQTYYNWLKDEEFAAELKQQQDSLYSGALTELKSLFNNAVDAYKALLTSNDESIKFRTASAIIDNTVKIIDNKELQERIEILEQATEEKRAK